MSMNPHKRTQGIDREHRLTGKVWYSMLQRCQNPKHKQYKNYGARRITVCEAWQTFAGFHADMGYKPDGLQLDRINNNGNYEPSNCRWATRSQQQQNKRPYTQGYIANQYGTFKVKTGEQL